MGPGRAASPSDCCREFRRSPPPLFLRSASPLCTSPVGSLLRPAPPRYYALRPRPPGGRAPTRCLSPHWLRLSPSPPTRPTSPNRFSTGRAPSTAARPTPVASPASPHCTALSRSTRRAPHHSSFRHRPGLGLPAPHALRKNIPIPWLTAAAVPPLPDGCRSRPLRPDQHTSGSTAGVTVRADTTPSSGGRSGGSLRQPWQLQ